MRRHAKHEFIPNALRGKIPRSWVFLLERSTKTASETAMIFVAFCLLYGTLLGPPHRSEWLYLLAASLGRLLITAWYFVFPFNPYRSMAAIREGMKNLDFNDEDAKAFALVFRSPQAQRFLLSIAWKLGFLFFIPMAIIVAGMQQIPIWRLGADTFIRIPFFFFVCLFLIFRIELLNWALKSSKASEVNK